MHVLTNRTILNVHAYVLVKSSFCWCETSQAQRAITPKLRQIAHSERTIICGHLHYVYYPNPTFTFTFTIFTVTLKKGFTFRGKKGLVPSNFLTEAKPSSASLTSQQLTGPTVTQPHQPTPAKASGFFSSMLSGASGPPPPPRSQPNQQQPTVHQQSGLAKRMNILYS